MNDITTPLKLCSTCRFWQATAERSSGICRRRAPTSTAVAMVTAPEYKYVLKTVWPSTGPGDYCGEHEVMP